MLLVFVHKGTLWCIKMGELWPAGCTGTEEQGSVAKASHWTPAAKLPAMTNIPVCLWSLRPACFSVHSPAPSKVTHRFTTVYVKWKWSQLRATTLMSVWRATIWVWSEGADRRETHAVFSLDVRAWNAVMLWPVHFFFFFFICRVLLCPLPMCCLDDKNRAGETQRGRDEWGGG